MEYHQQMKRITRALFYDTYFLLDVKSDLNALDFKLAGSSGNLYDINLLQNKFDCSCPDMKSGNFCCKHICYIVIKVLDLDNKTIFSKNIEVDKFKLLIENIDRLNSKIDKNSNIYKKFKNIHHFVEINKNVEDSCVVCYDKLEINNGIVKCSQCNKYICSSCFKLWFNHHKSCPYCRSYIITQTELDYVNIYDV